MPLHKDFQRVKREMEKKHGKEKGETIFYKWVQKHGYDDTKPLDKQKSKSKSDHYLDPMYDWMDEEEFDQMLEDEKKEKMVATNVVASMNTNTIKIPAYKMLYTAMPKDDRPDGPIDIKAITLEEGFNSNGWRVVPEDFPTVAAQYKEGRQLRLNHGTAVEDVFGKSYDSVVLKGREIAKYLGRIIEGVNPEGLYVGTSFEANPRDPQVRTNILAGYVETGSIGLEADAYCDECGEPLKAVGDAFERSCHHFDAGVKLKHPIVKEYSYVAEPAYQHTKAFPSFSAAMASIGGSSHNNPVISNNVMTDIPKVETISMEAKKAEEKEEEMMKKSDAEAYAEALFKKYKEGMVDAAKLFKTEVEAKKADSAPKTDAIAKVTTEKTEEKFSLTDFVQNPTKHYAEDPLFKELYKAAASSPKSPLKRWE